MRLIDADKVKDYILKEGFYCDTKADREATAKEIDSLFPTVEAIPIEWLRMWFTKKASLIGITLMGEIESDWEKENETNRR